MPGIVMEVEVEGEGIEGVCLVGILLTTYTQALGLLPASFNRIRSFGCKRAVKLSSGGCHISHDLPSTADVAIRMHYDKQRVPLRDNDPYLRTNA
jgi:hypothetical protein